MLYALFCKGKGTGDFLPLSFFAHGRKCALAVMFCTFTIHVFSQAPPAKQWDKRYGGSHSDALYTVLETEDGGYLLAGDSNSPADGDKTEDTWGSTDFWIIRVDSNGEKLWDRDYGGTDEEQLFKALPLEDGFLLAGWTSSESSGDISQGSEGFSDFWILKISPTGEKIWDKRYGGNREDELRDAVLTTDGGFILAGNSHSGVSGDKSQPTFGNNTDYWIIKLNAAGAKEWDADFGGYDEDELNTIKQCTDGGYILGGWTRSDTGGTMTQFNRGITDYWVVKTDAGGNKLWDARFGGDDKEYLYSLEVATDGGYLLAGYSASGISYDKTEDCAGLYDYWLVKINNQGIKQWDKRFGGSDDDKLKSVRSTSDGGYILAGWSQSGISGDKTQPNLGYSDYWIIKIDDQGNKQWDDDLGAIYEEKLHSIPQTKDMGYMLGGYTYSPAGDDVSQEGQGYNDYWILKLAPDCYSLQADFNYNNTGNIYYFTDSSTLAQHWLWSFGDGITDTLQNPIHHYVQTSAYNVCLVASDNCKSDTTCKLLDIATAVLPENSLQSSVSVSPNPFSGNSQITVTFSHATEMNLSIFGLDGTRFNTITNRAFDAGTYQFPISGTDLLPGIYVLQVNDGNEVLNKKLVVQ
jgi:hypothetical protein